MASVVSNWDLQPSSTPRAICLCSTAPLSSLESSALMNRIDGGNSNPFEQSRSEIPRPQHSLLIGTDEGALHYRAYPGLNSALPVRSTLRSSPQINSSPPTDRSARIPVISPLGAPVDFLDAVSGAVVAIVEGALQEFLVLVDDNRGANASPGTYAAHLVYLQRGSFMRKKGPGLPRMSAAAFHDNTGFVYAAGSSILSLAGEMSLLVHRFQCVNSLPSNARSGGSLALVCEGRVAVVSVNNSFFAVDSVGSPKPVLLLTLKPSSLHPVVHLELNLPQPENAAKLFLASGRECATVELLKDPLSTLSDPTVVTFVSPILAAVSIAKPLPLLSILTSDGLCHFRSPGCLGVPLNTVEVGSRPNNFFVLRELRDNENAKTHLVAISYSGHARIVLSKGESFQDKADRIMRLAIDAFGADNFPRIDLAEALRASFSAASHTGPETSPHTRNLLRQCLEAALGLSAFGSNEEAFLPSLTPGAFEDGDQPPSAQRLVCTALLCLLCTRLPNAPLCNRAAKACATISSDPPKATLRFCQKVVDQLLNHASQSLSLLEHYPGVNKVDKNSEFVEAGMWLLRGCGQHEEAIQVMRDRMAPPDGPWSPIKYQSYTAGHLGELAASGSARLIIGSPATRELLEQNPALGMSVLTSHHPQNAREWSESTDPLNDASLAGAIVGLLRSIDPSGLEPEGLSSFNIKDISADTPLPMDSGRSLAVIYLESAIGISTGRPEKGELGILDAFDSLPSADGHDERLSALHDELVFLLLEGVVGEMNANESHEKKTDVETNLGNIYRAKLQRFLSWPNAKYRPEQIISTLPSNFLWEHALLLGRLGKHEDALRILYCDLSDLDLALKYCDVRFERQQLARRSIISSRKDQARSKQKKGGPTIDDCVYLPLVRVALNTSSPSLGGGINAAIHIISLRRDSIDRSAALRLLPDTIPVSFVARPFLIPAIVDSESQVRRLKVLASLLRAKHLSLIRSLTDAQIRSQSDLESVRALKELSLGEKLRCSLPIQAKPGVTVVQHTYPRHVVIEAIVESPGKALCDVSFVVAESSDEAVLPLQSVPIKTLPQGASGTAWYVLSATPGRLDGPVVLTCELRFTVLGVDAVTGAPLHFSGGVRGRSYVEELRDLYIRPQDWS